jgi:hypothetical protein
MAKPNGYDCEQCPEWDDVNGCWADCKSFCGKEFGVDGEEIDPFSSEDFQEDFE